MAARNFSSEINFQKKILKLKQIYLLLKRDLEANHSKNLGLPLFFPTDPPLILLQNHMITIHTVVANRTKIKVAISWEEVVTDDSKSDLPLVEKFQKLI